MTLPTILVTGATGKTGSAVVSQLREKGWPVRAVVHSRDARSARLDSLGAETVVADAYDYAEMAATMQGTKRAYFCPPVQPYMIQAATVFALAAREARLESVVHLSMWLAAPAHPALHTRQQWLTEKLFAMIPETAHTTVNPGVFADPILQMLPTAANLGMLPNPFGDLRNPFPSNEDIARVITGALMDPERHNGKRYRPTGPALLSMDDVAEILSRVLGRKVVAKPVSEQMFMKAAKVSGAGKFEISNVRHFADDGKRGVFAVNGPTNDVFEVSGQQPEDFETIARRYAAMRFAKRSLGNTGRALGDFVKILLTPSFYPDRFDRAQGQPIPPNPQLAADSPTWWAEHEASTSEPASTHTAANGRLIHAVTN